MNSNMIPEVTIGIDARFILRPLRGIPLYVLRLCEMLPKQYPNANFIYFINKNFEHNEAPAIYEKRIANLQLIKNVEIVNQNSDGEIYWEQIILPRLLEQYQVDVFHMPANRICFFTKTQIVTTIHDLMEFQFLKTMDINIRSGVRTYLYGIRIRAYIWLIYKIGLKYSKRIITVSNYSRKDIISFARANECQVLTIYHGLENDFKPLKKSGFSTRRYVLMLGGDSYHKNPEGSIHAYAKLSSSIQERYPLKILGFCGDKNSRLYMALENTGLLDKVSLKSWVSQSEVIQSFQTAAVFMYMSRSEGFGFPALQAMACGTPVITSNCASIPEVIGNTGFQFDPDDYGGIANKLALLLTDKINWEKQSKLGIERAQQFSWKKSIQAHMDVYLKVIQSRKRHSNG